MGKKRVYNEIAKTLFLLKTSESYEDQQYFNEWKSKLEELHSLLPHLLPIERVVVIHLNLEESDPCKKLVFDGSCEKVKEFKVVVTPHLIDDIKIKTVYGDNEGDYYLLEYEDMLYKALLEILL